MKEFTLSNKQLEIYSTDSLLLRTSAAVGQTGYLVSYSASRATHHYFHSCYLYRQEKK